MELLKVDSLESAMEKLLGYAQNLPLPTERLPFDKAEGRTLAEDIVSPENVPAFPRSTVDGYAVRSPDTAAAGESIPVFLRLTGKIEIGKSTSISINPGECAEIPTGGMLPVSADAAVMLEYCESFGEGGIAVSSAVAPGENIVLPGEDVKEGAVLMRRGTVLRAGHIGALAASGIAKMRVFRPLKLSVISTGDELKDPREPLSMGEMRDVNSYALAALAAQRGYSVVRTALLPDDEAAISDAVRASMADCDVILISGGSSKGKKDATQKIISELASPGVFTHGLAMKPGKPTILGYDADSGTIIGGLPGHPAAAMMVFEMLFTRLLFELTGGKAPPPVSARISTNIAAAPGRLTCLPVRLEREGQALSAVPVFGKSGLISTLCEAEGYIVIGRNDEGRNAGESVDVFLF